MLQHVHLRLPTRVALPRNLRARAELLGLHGLQPAAEAVEATATGLVDAIVRHEAAGVRPSAESAKAANLPPTSRE
jgi:hypothetical protein